MSMLRTILLAVVTVAMTGMMVDGATAEVAPGSMGGYDANVAAVEHTMRAVTINDRTFHIPAFDAPAPAQAFAGSSVIRASTPMLFEGVAKPAAAVARDAASSGVGALGLALLLCVLGTGIFAAVSFSARRRAAPPEEPVLVTASGLVVRIDDQAKSGTGLITLTRRTSASHSKPRTEPTRRRTSEDALLDAIAEAEATIPDPTPQRSEIESLDDPFLEAERAVEEASERIRAKHESTRRSPRSRG